MLRQEHLIALLGKIEIALGRFPRLFLKSMKHIDRLLKLSDITDAVFQSGMD
jgi:hypothetical protein